MTDLNLNNAVHLLIVEDDDNHAELIQCHLAEVGIKNNIIRFNNGEEAWDFLNNKQTASNKCYLILLDIRMPKMSGVELLTKIKEDDSLKKIPIIMLTTTDDDREIDECYRLGCNCYITKPLDFKKFTETLTRLGLFLQIIQLSKN
jgi:CheY-like chemotaxis protein